MLQVQAVAIVLLLFAHESYSQYDYGYLNIDCGYGRDYISYDNLTWRSDSNYIDPRCGYPVKIHSGTTNPLNSLRAFPYDNKNCYTLPIFIKQKYLIRAGFLYSNYDNLEKPPIFDLQFAANKWARVVTIIDKPVYYGMVIVAQKRDLSVCLARIEDGGTPFISMIEMVQLLPQMGI